MQEIIDPKELSNFIALEDFVKYVGLEKVPSTSMFKNTLMKLKKYRVLKHYNYGESVYLRESEVGNYLSEHLSYNNLISKLNISPQTLRKVIYTHKIQAHFFGHTYDQIFIPKNLVRKYIANENFISGYEMLRLLGIDHLNKHSHRVAANRIVRNLQTDDVLCSMLGYKILEHPLYFKEHTSPLHDVFNKQSVIDFIESHISTIKIIEEFGMQRSNFLYMLTSNDISLYEFNSRHDCKFISVKDYKYLKEQRRLINNGASGMYLKNERYRALKSSNLYYTKHQVKSLLNLAEDSFEAFSEENVLLPKEIVDIELNDNSVIFYLKKDVDILLEKQKSLQIHYEENYYTIKQITNEFGKGNYHQQLYQAEMAGKIQSIGCPPLLRGVLNSHSKLYKKDEVNNLFSELRENRLMRTIEMDSPYSEFVYKTEIVLCTTFPDKLKGTKNLWYQFAKSSLYNKSVNNIKPQINLLSRISVVLSNTLTKEIFNHTANFLNKMIFNERVAINISYKCTIYDFYMDVITSLENKLGESHFQKELIVNPYTFVKNNTVDMSRYTFDEYKALYDHSTNITIHKQQAIEDVESYLNGKKYNSYDSYYVYILTHLTNNWRHSTIVSEIPEVDLSNTEIKNLNWLKKNNPSIKDANSIVFQIGRALKTITKTGSMTEFRISEPLKIPFATAVSICQFRANYISKDDNYGYKNHRQLLTLNKKRPIAPHYTLHKLFFKNFLVNFRFSNRKMNRTLTTLIWSVSKSLKAAQISRSHTDPDSTMHYIKLSDKQLEDLVNQLFERDSFGYINQLLIQKLFKNEGDDKEIETIRMSALLNKFGGVNKIEVSTGLLNNIAKQNEDVLNFVNGLSQNEVSRIISQSMTNTLYSKQKYYQCVFSECKFNTDSDDFQNCSSCPYSIINVYALSNLMNLYVEQIQNLINKFEAASHGEKQKLANHFFLLWRQIQNAKLKYGDVVYEFVDGGKDRFRNLSKQLPKTKKYLSEKVTERF